MGDTDADDAVVVLTGGTHGIGRYAARQLADRFGTVAVIGRDRAAGETLAAANDAVRFHRVDLSSQAAVRDLADTLLDIDDRLDVLVHNAGLASDTRRQSADGVEMTLAVNHLAPYLLTYRLFDRLRESRPSRVVVTASAIHRRGRLDFDDFEFERGYDGMKAYARSKLANVAFTVELAERLPDGMTAHCFHPGFVPGTELYRDASLPVRLAVRLADLLPGIGTSVAEGADRLVTLVTAPRYGERSGQYVTGTGPEAPSEVALDPDIRHRLWDRSAALVGIDPAWPRSGA